MQTGDRLESTIEASEVLITEAKAEAFAMIDDALAVGQIDSGDLRTAGDHGIEIALLGHFSISDDAVFTEPKPRAPVNLQKPILDDSLQIGERLEDASDADDVEETVFNTVALSSLLEVLGHVNLTSYAFDGFPTLPSASADVPWGELESETLPEVPDIVLFFAKDSGESHVGHDAPPLFDRQHAYLRDLFSDRKHDFATLDSLQEFFVAPNTVTGSLPATHTLLHAL